MISPPSSLQFRKGSAAKKGSSCNPDDKKSKKVATAAVQPTFRFLSFRVTSENWVMYSIEITQGANKWRFESRYSLLKVFEEKLLEDISGDSEKLPEFPKKKWFGNLSDEFIKERMVQI
jgi:hypothetical protein